MSASERFPLTPHEITILKESRVAFCDAVKGKFGCAAVIHNVESGTASSFGNNKVTIVPEIKYSKQLSNGLTVSVWKDDLTTHQADAVVNAANERLNHGGGLALALSNAGGPEIQQMSDQIIKTYGLVHTGDAVVTPAGKLPCKHIIHAVGPSVKTNASKKEIDNAAYFLEKTILSIFQITEFHNLQSVAIPAISSGLFNFPRSICANIIVRTVRSFMDKRNPQMRSLEIRLVNNDDPSVQEMLRACTEILGSPHSQSGAMQIQSKAPTRSDGSSLELGNVTLHLKKGSIEQETTCVIVNTIAPDLNLSQGYVSKAILEKAGPKIQIEIKKIGRGYDPLPGGNVIETAGHKLNCKAVYHTVCPSSSTSSSASQTLHRLITRCLDKAENRNVPSISFPAIGTGNLGFKKEEVSQIMTSAVIEFAEKYKGMKMDVYFVIFPKDQEIFMAFEKELASIKKRPGLYKMSFSTTGNSSVFHDSKESKDTTPLIELLANSTEALREAKAWAMRMLHISSCVTINNNHIIQFGQEDHAKLISLQGKFSVFITELFSEGKCGLRIIGEPIGVSCAALEVEAMLCQAQENFAQAEENDLHSVVYWQSFPGSEQPETSDALGKDNLHVLSLTDQDSKSFYTRTVIDEQNYGQKEKEKLKKFKKGGLEIVKMEKIENNALKQVFELNRKRVPDKSQRLYQRVSAQFCELICRVGFQRDYAPPKEQKYGAGIYFTKEVEKALGLWQDADEEYIYLVEAQVLTGNDKLGSPEMIVAPPLINGPLGHYDSVTSAKKDIYVIFHGQQALPELLITCKRFSTSV